MHIKDGHELCLPSNQTFIIMFNNDKPDKLQVTTVDKMLSKAFRSMLNEFHLMWLFLRLDHGSYVLHGLGFSCSALVVKTPDSSYDLACSFVTILTYSALCVYSHSLANQYRGVEEDRVNKPNRPIPCGYATTQGTLHRYYIVSGAYLLFCTYHIQLLPGAILWIVLNYLHYLIPIEGYVAKMLFVVMSNIALTVNPWLLVTNVDKNCVAAFIYVEFLVFVIGLMQDIRDLPGDYAVQRITLPMVMDIWKLKRIISSLMMLNAFVVVAAPLLLIKYDYVQCNVRPEICMLYVLIQFGLILISAQRTLKKSTTYHYENMTYYCYLVQSAIAFYFPSFLSFKNRDW